MAGMNINSVDHPLYGPCLRLTNGASSALVGLRGGQVLSWTCGGQEQLYLSERSRHAPGASIRGGIPIIFPQFADDGPGPRHGFARTSVWQPIEAPPGQGIACVRLRLEDAPATQSVWPHAFVLEQTVSLDVTRLDVELTVRNTDDHAWSFSAALHSYWRIEAGHRVQVDALADVPFRDRSESGCRSPVRGPLSTEDEIERLYRNAPSEVVLRHTRSLQLASEGWPDLMVWNPGPDKGRALSDLDPAGHERFLCVEPLQYENLRLEPGDTWRAKHAALLLPG